MDGQLLDLGYFDDEKDFEYFWTLCVLTLVNLQPSWTLVELQSYWAYVGLCLVPNSTMGFWLPSVSPYL